MSSEKQFREGEYVLTPLSNLVVGEENGHKLAVGAARIKDIEREDETEVVVAFNALQGAGLMALANEQNHDAIDIITGPQTAWFRPQELRRTSKPNAPVPVDELEPLPDLISE